MIAIGLDLGTTSLCSLLFDGESGRVLYCETLSAPPLDTAGETFARVQDAVDYLARARACADRLIERAGGKVDAIGITGQMHGIVYLDSQGSVLSPLYTWQDGRGGVPEDDGTCASDAFAAHGYRVPAGYGMATHLYNCRHGLVPQDATCFSTIHDCLAAQLCGLPRPLTHVSDAASFGLVGPDGTAFDTDTARKLGMNPALFPAVTAGAQCLGTYCGIPVTVAIGDNQASFLGSVAEPEGAVLVNIGTGGQISVHTDSAAVPAAGEVRPLGDGQFLLCGCSLCAGQSLALVERFFRETAVRLGLPAEARYDLISQLQEEPEPDDPLCIATTFRGTRDDPASRGSIANLSDRNFTPVALVHGVMNGIAEELCGYYDAFSGGRSPAHLYGSGNGLRRNPQLRRIFERRLGHPMQIPLCPEEAAVGAARFALRGISGADGASAHILYEDA